MILLTRDLYSVWKTHPQVLREAIPCLCHVVMHVTHDAAPLEELLVIFAEKIEAALSAAESSSAQESGTLSKDRETSQSNCGANDSHLC